MGEMYEKSPFTMMDLIRQRERWLQGIWLVVKSSKIPWGTKFWLATALYAWISLPLASLCIFGMISEVPYTYYLKPINALTMSSTVYMYLFGLVKSFDLKQSSFAILVLYFFLQILMVAVCFVVENLVVIYGVFTNKHHFYIVEKESKPKLQDGQKAAPVVARF
jgi:egghead protein (zeste-white 4 protein)